MAVAAQVVAKVNADISGLKQGYQQAKDETEKQKSWFKGAMSDMFSVAGGFLLSSGIQYGMQLITSGISDVVTETQAMSSQMNLLNATLQSTHDASGMTSDGIMSIVQGLSNLTGAQQSTVLSGENMLLTFTNIGSSVFPLASTAMMNMAIAMNHGSTQGLDLKDTAIQLGKALNDPLTGITALSRVGVTFTQQQKDQIKAMMDAGNVAGAQQIILQELQREFGGAAQAAGSTFGGSIDRVKNTLIDFGVNVLTKVEGWLQPFVDQLAIHLPDALSALGDFLGQIGGKVQQFFGSFSGLGSGFNFGGIVKDLQGFASTVQQQVMPIAKQLSDWFMTTMLPAIASVQPVITSFAQFIINKVVPAFIQFETFAAKTGTTIASLLIPIFEKVAPLVVKLGGFVLDLVQKGLAFLIPYVVDAEKAISQFATEMSTRLGPFIEKLTVGIQVAAQIIQAVWTALWPYLSAVLKTVWDEISGIIKFAWDLITGIFKIGADLLSGNWGQLWTDVKDIASGLWSDITTLFGNLWTDLGNMIANNPIMQFFNNFFIQPVKNAVQAAIGWIEGLWQDFINWITGNTGGKGSAPNPTKSGNYKGGKGFASGGLVTSNAPITMNEQGGEMVKLPTGSYVYPAGQFPPELINTLKQAVGGRSGPTQNVTINGVADTKVIVDALKLHNMQQKALAGLT